MCTVIKTYLRLACKLELSYMLVEITVQRDFEVHVYILNIKFVKRYLFKSK